MTAVDDSRRPRSWTAYVVPFVLYLVLTAVAGRMGAGYAIAYCAAVCVVAVATWRLLRGRQILQPHSRLIAPVVLGVIGIVLWIVLSSLQIDQAISTNWPSWMQPQPRAAFNPFVELASPAAAWCFITVRLVGLVVLTPIVEELFWRGFLMRWIDTPDWEDAPLGVFHVRSFVVVTLLFTAAHPEWIAAAIYCVLLNVLIYWKKDLWSCVVAHAVSNLVLALYILTTASWWLW